MFEYRNSFNSVTEDLSVTNDEPIIVYSKEICNYEGYGYVRQILNYTGIDIIVCRRDGINVKIPPTPLRTTKPNQFKNCVVILHEHSFGNGMPREYCFANCGEISHADMTNSVKAYKDQLDNLTFSPLTPMNSYDPKHQNKIELNTVVSLDLINDNDGGFYLFKDDITIARADAPEAQVHPFCLKADTNFVRYQGESNSAIEVRFNDTERKFPDQLYYMVGNLPIRILVTRDCVFPNGIFVNYHDAFSKKLSSIYYPIEDVIDGSATDKLDYEKPIVYRSRSDAVKYGKGEDIIKNITAQIKLQMEIEKQQAQTQKLEYDERVKQLDIEKAKFEEESRRLEQERKQKQEEFEHKVKLEELRIKHMREDAVSREKMSAEQWKGMIAIASGFIGILVLVLKR